LVLGVGVGTAGLGFVGGGAVVAGLALGGYKFIEWTQERQPLIITPVMLNGKPFLAGLDGFKSNSLWVSIKGRWRNFCRDVDEGWDTFWKTSAITDTILEGIGGTVQ
jgi:hypothetical protein